MSSTRPHATTLCWHCRETLEEEALFCPACQAVQPVQQNTLFSLLGIAYAYEVDISEIERRYLALQRQLHPDRFIGRSAKERELASQWSSSVNEAYGILKNPLRRAEYMLELEGLPVHKDGSAVKPSQALLITSMEQRERLLEATTHEATRALAEEAATMRREAIRRIAVCFKETSFREMAEQAMTLKYLEKLLEEIKRKDAAL